MFEGEAKTTIFLSIFAAGLLIAIPMLTQAKKADEIHPDTAMPVTPRNYELTSEHQALSEAKKIDTDQNDADNPVDTESAKTEEFAPKATESIAKSNAVESSDEGLLESITGIRLFGL